MRFSAYADIRSKVSQCVVFSKITHAQYSSRYSTLQMISLDCDPACDGGCSGTGRKSCNKCNPGWKEIEGEKGCEGKTIRKV